MKIQIKQIKELKLIEIDAKPAIEMSKSILINSIETLKQSEELATKIKSFEKEIELIRKKEVHHYNEHVKKINNFFKKTSFELLEARKILTTTIINYVKKENKKQEKYGLLN